MNRNQPYRTIRHNQMHWIVAEEYTSVLPGELVEKVKHAAVHSECKVIRENNVRVSLLFSLPGRKEVVFVKRYKCRGLMDSVKYFIFTSKASAEWRNIQRFLRKGIQVAVPLAKGEKRRFHCVLDSYLVTEAFTPAVSLNSYLGKQVRAGDVAGALEKRKTIIKKLALLVGKIHSAGFFYRDLHAGNIVVVEGDKGELQLYPIDLHKAWYLGKVPRRMCIRDLAQLKNSLPASRTEQVRFLREYAGRNLYFGKEFKVNARCIEKKADALRDVHLRSRTKRCVINSSEFAVKKDGTQSFYHNKIYPEKLLAEILEKYTHAAKSSDRTVLKKTFKETVSVITISHNKRELKVLAKESRCTGILNRLRYVFFQSRARKYWIAARGLTVRGVSTPHALALIEKRSLGMPTENILFTEFIDHACELNEFVIKSFREITTPDEKNRKARFIKDCAHAIKDLHEKNIYHADLKSNNILVKEESGNTWKFYFIDLDRVAFRRSLSFSQRSNNLAQINASIAECINPSDRLKFFKAYANGTPVMKQKKRFYRRIREISRRKITQPYGVSFTSPERNIF